MSTAAQERAKAQRYAALNRRARHDYFITDTVEAGMMLLGPVQDAVSCMPP